MKKNLRIGLLMIASSVCSYSFAQEAVLASVETKTEETTPTEEGKKEEEDAPALSISGSIDTYARTALGKSSGISGMPAPTSAFSNLKGFGIGMANVILSYGGEKSGFVADLVFGPRGSDAVFNSGSYVNAAGGSSSQIVNQLYAWYKITDKTTLNLGQFNTFLGYEVISPAVNFHYSTSYLFSYGPFSHTGLRADFDLGNGLVAKAAIMNPTDVLEFNPVNTYTLGGQLGHSSDAGGIWLNLIYGDYDGKLKKDVDAPGSTSAGSTFQVDVTTGWNLGEKFYLGFNASMQSTAVGDSVSTTSGEVESLEGDASSFVGFAVYPKITISESFALGARVEYFSVSQDYLPGAVVTDASGDGSITSFTISGNYKIGGLTLIPEIRMDSASEDSFADLEGKASKSMTSLLLAAVYKF